MRVFVCEYKEHLMLFYSQLAFGISFDITIGKQIDFFERVLDKKEIGEKEEVTVYDGSNSFKISGSWIIISDYDLQCWNDVEDNTIKLCMM
jgi:hypothetical protein